MIFWWTKRTISATLEPIHCRQVVIYERWHSEVCERNFVQSRSYTWIQCTTTWWWIVVCQTFIPPRITHKLFLPAPPTLSPHPPPHTTRRCTCEVSMWDILEKKVIYSGYINYFRWAYRLNLDIECTHILNADGLYFGFIHRSCGEIGSREAHWLKVIGTPFLFIASHELSLWRFNID